MSSKTAATKSKKAAAASSSSSGSDSDSSTKKKTPTNAAKPKPAPAKKKAAASSSESDDASSSSASSESESDDEKPKKKPAAKAKPAPAKKKPSKADSSASDSSDSDSDKKKKPTKPAPVSKRQAAAAKLDAAEKKPAEKPKAPVNAFAGLEDEEDDDASESEPSESESEDEKKPAAKKPVAAKGKAKPAAKKAESDDEDGADASSSKPAAKGGKKGAPAKKADDDDLDDLFADLSVGVPKNADGTPDESKMTKAQLKRHRQKQKQEAEKANPSAAAAAATTPTAAAPAAEKKEKEKKEKKDDGKPAKGNKQVEALKAQIKANQDAEAARRQAELDRIAAEEAEKKRLEEEVRLAAEKKATLAAARAAKKAADKAAGLVVTASEAAKRAKNEAFRKQLEAAGMVPAALQQKAVATASPDDDAASTASGDSTASKPSKKDQRHKGKSAFGKRQEAEKEAERIRAERHAAEDVTRAQNKAEEERRKKEDAELQAKILAQIAEVDEEEHKLDEPLPELVSEVEEEVVDSWEDADSDEESKKATAREERRAARIKQRQDLIKERDARRVALAKKRDEIARERDAQLAEIKKQRQVVDEAKRVKAEAARAAQEEKDRAAAAVAGGFEIEQVQKPAEDDTTASTAVTDKKKQRDNLRSPIACILGHVDTGKTKILDNIRSTDVQKGEAGGITQQIGATFMPRADIIKKTDELNKFRGKELTMDTPGFLVIDTPGHESFTNLRSRGSNLCDIAILVIDIMAGLEQQTIESINLLKQRKTPFVIALNKIDRCYGWKAKPNAPFQVTYASQGDSTKQEYQKRCTEAIVLMAQQGLNCVPYYENQDFRKCIPDLLMLLVQLTQNMMSERLSYVSELSCTVLEVKVVEGLGTTIDVILVNGVLHVGDTIVVCGLTGPIVTTVRALLTPPPMQEIRVKSEYVHHKLVRAAMGVKISAAGLETAIAGSSLLVCGPKDNVEDLKDEVQGDLATILSKVDKSGQGVSVQASTLGSLEALLAFLGDMKIPVSSISIGPVHKKDVMKAAVMLEKRPEFGVLLCFDVKVAPDAAKVADELGVKIFTADIIYHLFDACTKYMEEVKQKKRVESAETAVFPVVLDILPNAIFNVKSPIVMGVRVVDGTARIGTPICIPSKDFLFIGRITGIQKNHTDFTEAKKGEEFACKIEQAKSDQQVIFGRHFDASCQLVSRITRESIDLLKANFKDDVSQNDWKLIVKLKARFNIV